MKSWSVSAREMSAMSVKSAISAPVPAPALVARTARALLEAAAAAVVVERRLGLRAVAATAVLPAVAAVGKAEATEVAGKIFIFVGFNCVLIFGFSFSIIGIRNVFLAGNPLFLRSSVGEALVPLPSNRALLPDGLRASARRQCHSVFLCRANFPRGFFCVETASRFSARPRPQ